MDDLRIFILLWFVTVLVLMLIGKTNSTGDGPMGFETRRLAFASIVLSGLGLIFVFVIGVYFFSEVQPEGKVYPAKEIFDATKTIIPPIITLVLGYYFGQIQKDEPTTLQDEDSSNEEDT